MRVLSKLGAWILTASYITSLAGPAALSQALPNFTTGPGGETNLLTNSSPAVASVPGENKIYVAYQDHNTNNLFISTSTVGGGASAWSNPTNTGFPVNRGDGTQNAASVAAVGNGSQAYIVFQQAGQFSYTIASNNGTSYTPVKRVIISLPTGVGLLSNFRPGLAYFNGYLYMSVTATFNGTPFAYVVRSSDNGATFSNAFGIGYTPNSGSSLAVYAPPGRSPELWWCFTTGASNNFVLAVSSDGNSFGTGNPDTAAQFGGDPALIPFFAPGSSSPALYIFGRSNFSANNEWATGTYNGTNFTTAFKYAQTLTQSPGVAIVPSNGYLITVYKSNFGSNIWNSSAPHQ